MPTTSPDGFFYPDDSSDSDLTQHIQTLAANVQSKFTAQETWNSWTPTFNTPTDGGITAVGTGGHASGFYRRSAPGSGALIYAEFRFLLGSSGFATGSGVFTLNLPVAAYAWGGGALSCQNATVGSWTMRDNGSSPVDHFSGQLGLYYDTHGLQAHFAGCPGPNSGDTDPLTPRYRMDVNDPITWGAADNLTGQLFYRAA
jgi:hypothetical protein